MAERGVVEKREIKRRGVKRGGAEIAIKGASDPGGVPGNATWNSVSKDENGRVGRVAPSSKSCRVISWQGSG